MKDTKISKINFLIDLLWISNSLLYSWKKSQRTPLYLNNAGGIIKLFQESKVIAYTSEADATYVQLDVLYINICFRAKFSKVPLLTRCLYLLGYTNTFFLS